MNALNVFTTPHHKKPSNLFAIAPKRKDRKEALEKYERIRLWLIITGAALCFAAAVMLGIERVWLETTEAATLSSLAYGYNTFFIVGGALVGATAFHTKAKRNAEITRLARIAAELEQIKIDRLHLLNEIEEGHHDVEHH
jgi:hypothetical protein